MAAVDRAVIQRLPRRRLHPIASAPRASIGAHTAVSGPGAAQPPHPPGDGGRGGGASGVTGGVTGASAGGAAGVEEAGAPGRAAVAAALGGAAGEGGWLVALSSCPSTSFGTGRVLGLAGRHHTSDQLDAPRERQLWANP